MNMVVAEGVKTCEAAYALAQKADVEMPLLEGVYRVLYENMAPADVLHGLMTRKAKPEDD